LNFQLDVESKNKKFKEKEDLTIDNSEQNQNLASETTSHPQPGLPFMSNINLNTEIITQMLIKKLSANNGLSNLNDICRILPDTIWNRARSHTQ